MKNTLLTGMALSMPLGNSWAGSGAAPKQRQFTLNLDPGSVGIKADLPELVRLAAKHGFEAVSPSANALAEMDKKSVGKIRAEIQEKGLVWGVTGLPMDFRKDQQTFDSGLVKLSKIAPKLEQAGVTRMGTWVLPFHNELTYLQNFNLHRDRIRQIAAVLGKHNIRFGLEYVGPRSLWSSGRYPFAHSLAETQELIAAIGEANVGLVLDTYHWYNADETKADLLSLKNEDVVSCDLNDAVAGLEKYQQRDLFRELPLATGMIDTKQFLEALVEIGYDGPIRAEPFSRSLNLLDNETAAAATAQAMKAAFALVE